MNYSVLQRTLLGGSLIASTWCGLMLIQSRAATRPPLVTDNSLIPVGVVAPGANVDLSFSLTANVPVNILKVVTSCSCIVVNVDDLELQAGEQAKVNLKWNVPPANGNVEMRALVMYRNLSAEKGDFALDTLALEATAIVQGEAKSDFNDRVPAS